jgi:hypothetical protein
MQNDFKNHIEKLTGQPIPLNENIQLVDDLTHDGLKLGYSQFNELLLLLGYDRISSSFFQFLADGTVDYLEQTTITSQEILFKNIDKAVEFFLRLFGNIKFGYKKLSNVAYEAEFNEWYYVQQPKATEYYTDRHKPLIPIDKIDDDDTYLLGYIIQDEIKARLKAGSADQAILDLKTKMDIAIEKGNKNHKAYLACDHMDVYVATSMRQKHEFLFISRITDEIFNHENLKNLGVRYFDPTQAYCADRIDKGIAEALMLKRASCTIYLAQETDTLGKDSELASTLAQGKTVIAFIPEGDKEYVDKLLKDLKEVNPEQTRKQIISEQLCMFDPELCWIDKQLREWIDSNEASEEYGLNLLYRTVKTKCDKRAKTLKDTHPLGIQVNLETGVANGVIVTRDIGQCAKLVRNVLLGLLEFDVVEEERNGIPYIFLKEKETKSVYRVSTGEKLLENTFWNYYLPKIQN